MAAGRPTWSRPTSSAGQSDIEYGSSGKSLTRARSPPTSGRNQGSCPGSWPSVFWVRTFRQRVSLASSQSTASLPRMRSSRKWRGKLFVDRCRLSVTGQGYRALPCNQFSGSLSRSICEGRIPSNSRQVVSLMRTRCCTPRRTSVCMPFSKALISISIRHRLFWKTGYLWRR